MLSSDWRSGIVTVTIRDSRNREYDLVLGVVPLKLSDVLDTSSQVTRWYPLDGGIGFGRVRISLLFRSIETRLPPNMLGWDVGTFEFNTIQAILRSVTGCISIEYPKGTIFGPPNIRSLDWLIDDQAFHIRGCASWVKLNPS
jgi:Ca2+-dependent lipid-binding protein